MTDVSSSKSGRISPTLVAHGITNTSKECHRIVSSIPNWRFKAYRVVKGRGGGIDILIIILLEYLKVEEKKYSYTSRVNSLLKV